MKKTFLFITLLLVGCLGLATFDAGYVSLKLPSGWQEGITPDKPYIKLSFWSKNAGYTVETLVNDAQTLFESPKLNQMNIGIELSGILRSVDSESIVKVGNFTMTKRDVFVEIQRLKQTGMKASEDIIENLAIAHVNEMAYVLHDASLKDLMPTDIEIEEELNNSYSQALSKGLTSEAYLANWGISAWELKRLVVQKLAYARAINKETIGSNDDSEANSRATTYLRQLQEYYQKDAIEQIEDKTALVHVKEIDGYIVLSIGSKAGQLNEDTLRKVFNSIEIKDTGLPSGFMIYFSQGGK